jgi:hypothetical protein
MYNVCFDSDSRNFDCFEYAHEYLCHCVMDQMSSDGIDQDDDDSLYEYLNEYSVEEYDESIDRLMWSGTRYVLKKDYYKVTA